MDARFESDIAELSGDGSYLLACAERKMLFHEAATAGKHPLAEVAEVRVGGDGLIADLTDGRTLSLPFASASKDELEDAAKRLSACIQAWR